jgi:succinate dehydrogenase hydrophobic anchor subunit
MTKKIILLIALLLPILLPAVMFPFTGMPMPHHMYGGWAFQDNHTGVRSDFAANYLLLVTASAIALFPYVVFVMCVVAWGWKKSERTILWMSWLLPLAFIPFLFIWLSAVGVFGGLRPSIMAFIRNMPLAFAFSLLAIPFGYFYVFIGNILVFAASKIRLIGKSS